MGAEGKADSLQELITGFVRLNERAQMHTLVSKAADSATLVAFDLSIRQSIAIPEWPFCHAEWNGQDYFGMTRMAQILLFLCNSEAILD